MTPASVKQFQVTFDCAEPERVARFWCEVLGYVVPPPPEGFATWDEFDRALPPEQQGSAFACIDPTGVGPRLFFQRVPEGKVVKNRLHLDVRVGTGLVGEERLAALEAECARLVALGAVRVRLLPADGVQRVLPRDAGHRGQRVLSRLSGDGQAEPVLWCDRVWGRNCGGFLVLVLVFLALVGLVVWLLTRRTRH